MCVGNDCCAPDPQRHLWLKLSHLWCDYRGLMVLWSRWHRWDGSHGAFPNPCKQNCIFLHKFQEDWISSSKKKREVSPSACRVPISQTVQHPLEEFVNTSHFHCYAAACPVLHRNTFWFPISAGMFAYLLSTVLAFRKLKQKGSDPLPEILFHSALVLFMAEWWIPI